MRWGENNSHDSIFAETSTDVEINPQNFVTFSFDPFALLV